MMSTYETIPFRSEHTRALRLQPEQAHLVSVVAEPGYAEALYENSLTAVSVFANGRIVACGGVIEVWQDRGFAWALISKGLPSQFIAIHRAARLMIESCGLGRIEAYIDSGFAEGCRWMDLLGFELDTPKPMQRFANGRDCYLYSRVFE